MSAAPIVNTPPNVGPASKKFLIVGIIGLVLSGIGFTMNSKQFLQSYLLNWVYWSNFALGSMILLMIQYLTGGAWGVMGRRVLESGARTLLLAAVLFLPIVFGMDSIYKWTNIDPADKILKAKELYLNKPFFLIRAAVYFSLWAFWIWVLVKASRREDSEGAGKATILMRMMSGPGVVMYGLTITFASVDWMLSLDPHYYSTMYPVQYFVGQILATMALLIVMMTLLRNSAPFANVLGPGHIHQMGKLLLAFTMVWAYVNFSAYLITWQGNIAEEVPWYLKRLRDGWWMLPVVLMVFHFVVPFLLLLSRSLKRNPVTLVKVAVLILVIRYIDLYWLIRPAKSGTPVTPSWMDLALFVGIGGVWLWAFLAMLSRTPALPLNDPNFEEALHRGKH